MRPPRHGPPNAAPFSAPHDRAPGGTSGPGRLHRRTFLKMAAGAAVAAPGTWLLDQYLGAQGGSEGPAEAGAGGDGTATTALVTVGGASLRPPSIPLAVRSPYLSTWLETTELAGATPQFWPGSTRGLVGLVRIDGMPFAWAGDPGAAGVGIPPMAQTSAQVTATRSIFTMEAAGVQVVAEWLSPVEPGDLRWQSAPLSLLTVTVASVDGSAHAVQLYADITGTWASADDDAVVEWQTAAHASSRSWTVQLAHQQPLTERGQMAQWGHVVWAAPRGGSLTYQSGAAADVRRLFVRTGILADTSDPDFRSAGDNQPVFAFARDFGFAATVTASFALGHVRAPLVSYGAHGAALAPLWTRYWRDWQSMTDDFLAGAAAARRRAADLDATIQGAATKAGGPGYSAMCALSLRQCYGGTELAVGPRGQPWLMGKEISSGGFVNTVDIFDQAFLAWLWLDPALVPLVMEPVLDWCASPAWQDSPAWAGIASWKDSGTTYCVHDLGVYPVAGGRAPGDGEQMPIEESAGMLIMAAAYARKVGARAAKPFLARWSRLWTQWAEYLLTQVPTPATQLCTDDWAPQYAVATGSVNLALKAMVGLAAAGQIASVLGDTDNAARWASAAEDGVGPWVTLSTDASGGHLNLAQGAPGTWSTLYNAYYEKVVGSGLVPEQVAAMQADFYLGQLTSYGMPLQSASANVTKVEWLVFLTAWLEGYPVSSELLNRDVAYLDGTPSLVPYCDRYDTTDGTQVRGIKAHPTVGATFALLAGDPTFAPLAAE